MDYYKLYFRLLKSAPKAIFAILTRESFRDFWIGESANERIQKSIENDLLSSVRRILGEDLKIIKRNTEAMWDSIVRDDVRVMILGIEPSTFVKNAGAFSEKLSYADVNGKFLILNGLEYQCNDASKELLYMEV